MNILYVEDNAADAELFTLALKKSPVSANAVVTSTLAEARTLLSNADRFDLGIIDLHLPDGSGLELLTEIRQMKLPMAVIILTGQGDEESAIKALKAGADDYLIKNDGYLERFTGVMLNALHRFKAQEDRFRSQMKVLYIEHNESDIDLTKRHLALHAPHIKLEVIHSADIVLGKISRGELPAGSYDVFLVDYRLPGLSALELQKTLVDSRIDIPIVLVTGHGNEETAVQAIRLGAADYLVKQPGYLFQLPTALENAYNRYSLAREKVALKESEERYRRLAENAQDIIYSVYLQPEIGFRYVSPAATGITGYDPEEFYATPGLFYNQVHPEDRSLVEALTGEEDSFKEELTVRFIKKDGETIWIEQRNVPIYDSHTRLVAFEGIARDITDRKLAEESRKRRNRELEALQKVSTALRTTGTLDKLLPTFLDHILTIFNTDSGAIWLYDQVSDMLLFSEARGWLENIRDSTWEPGEGIAGHVFTAGEIYVSDEIAADPLSKKSTLGVVPQQCGGVYLPIKTGNLTIGVLALYRTQPLNLSSEDLSLLVSLSEMVGTAIHRISLHEETDKRLNQLQSLRTVDIAISSNKDMQYILNILLEHLNKQLNVDATAVFLFNRHLKNLHYHIGKGFAEDNIFENAIALGESAVGKAALERKMIISSGEKNRVNDQLNVIAKENDFQTYIALPLIAKGELKGVLLLFLYDLATPDKDWFNYLETMSGQAAIAIESGQLFEELQKANLELSMAYDETIEGWSRALDLRDHETEGHCNRVTDITIELARFLGVADNNLVHIRRGCLLHDIGKVGIPDSILLKPGKLTPEEWEIMQQHPQLAYELLSPIQYLQPALDIPYCHHEKWDGSGYPRNLKGKEIPLAARIFAVVDVFDALTSDRPYRTAWEKEQALQYIREESGTHFDPEIVKHFLDLIDKRPTLILKTECKYKEIGN